jgi:hypothetical protein
MIKLYTLYDQKLVTEITPFCKTIQWSGDKSQAARKLDVTLGYAIWDKNQPKVQVMPGTFVWMVENGKELFRGTVVDRDLTSNEELKFVAYDYLIYFLKSKVTYNFTNIVSEAAVEQIATDLGVKYNRIPTIDIPVNKIIKSKSAYDAIMSIYTDISFKNGKQYIPIIDSDQLSVIEKGALIDDTTFILQPSINMGQSTYSDSISNMINKIRIFDDKGNVQGEVKNDDSVNTYGVFQDIYEIQQDKDTNEEVSNIMHGMDRTIKATVLGNTKCITGYAIKAKIPYVEILKDTTLYIDGDTHTWDVGTNKYTMELTLNLDNIMDKKEA